MMRDSTFTSSFSILTIGIMSYSFVSGMVTTDVGPDADADADADAATDAADANADAVRHTGAAIPLTQTQTQAQT